MIKNKYSDTVPVSPSWVWLIPNIAMVLVLVLLATLLWLSHRRDIEEQHDNLIADLLWVEQNFRFNLEQTQQLLSEIGQETHDKRLNANDFDNRIRSLIKNHNELVQVTLLNKEGVLEQHYPHANNPDSEAQLPTESVSADAQRISRLMAKPAYTGVYQTSNGQHRFALYAPLFDNGQFAGQIVGEYALQGMMSQLVPWWYAQKYQLAMQDLSGKTLLTKSAVQVNNPDLSYNLPLSSLNNTVILRATAYKEQSNQIRNLLIMAILLLAIISLSSLLALRRHMHRRLAAEKQLLAEHAFRQAMEDSIITGMRARDLQGRTTYVNAAFCQMTGYAAEELLDQVPPHPYWSSEHLEETRAALEKVLAGDAPSEGFELRFRRKNGEFFDALIHEAPLIDAAGNHTGWMGSVLDITERKRTEELNRQQHEHLQLTARLVTMGEMASTLAHELNQPLSAITSYLTGAQNHLERGTLKDSELRHVLDTAATQARRAGKIISRIHEFVRRREPRRKRCEINQVVEEAVGFLEAEARKSHVHLQVQLTPDLPPVHADMILLVQVLVNLLKNGMEAMQTNNTNNKTLQISTELLGNLVQVSVTDQGLGIAADVAEKLFSAFFTTKEVGMGMGLNICRSIIELHHGQLWFAPNPAGGSIFRFTLPIDATEPEVGLTDSISMTASIQD